MTELTESLGFFAAFCTTFAFVPQVLHTLRTRDVSGISLGMYGIFTLGVLAWFCYGLVLGSLPIIVANACTFALAASVLYLKFRHRHDDKG